MHSAMQATREHCNANIYLQSGCELASIQKDYVAENQECLTTATLEMQKYWEKSFVNENSAGGLC